MAGPLCGMTYTFAAPGNPKPPSRNLDEIFVEEEGSVLQISSHLPVHPYPPAVGVLAIFLQSLRRQLPEWRSLSRQRTRQGIYFKWFDLYWHDPAHGVVSATYAKVLGELTV